MDSVFVANRCDSLREGGFTNFFVSMLVNQHLPSLSLLPLLSPEEDILTEYLYLDLSFSVSCYPTSHNTTGSFLVALPKASHPTSSYLVSHQQMPSSGTFLHCPNHEPMSLAVKKSALSNARPDCWVLPKSEHNGFASPSCSLLSREISW